MKDHFTPAGDGRTELSDEDRQGLVPAYIATRGDLFEAEQRNLMLAMFNRRPTIDQLLDDRFLRDLHGAMFGDVWRWAGRYRQRETNIGIEPTAIAGAVRGLVDDAKAWIEYATYPPDEVAVRYHHRLVAIHPFPNGNGRFSRIAADHLVTRLGRASFTWGANLYLDAAKLRAAYLAVLRRADHGSVSDLVRFARE